MKSHEILITIPYSETLWTKISNPTFLLQGLQDLLQRSCFSSKHQEKLIYFIQADEEGS